MARPAEGVGGPRAEALGKILSTCSRLFVEGSLRTSSYEDRDGNKRYKTEVNALNVVLCGGRGGGAGSVREGGSDFDEAAPPAAGYDDPGFGGDRGGDDEFPF